MGAATLAILPMEKWLLPMGKPRVNFYGYVEKNKRIKHDISRVKFLKKTKAAQPITKKWNVPNNRKHVLFTRWILGAKSYSKFENSARFWSLALFLQIKPVLLTVERQFAIVYNDVFPRNQFQVFSSPLENLSLCNCKHQNGQNPEWTQPELFYHLKRCRGRRLVWPHLLSHDLHWENKA